MEEDSNLLKQFGEDLKLIFEKYDLNEVNDEKEFQEQIRKIDGKINHKLKELDGKLKIYKSDQIKIDKIRNEDKPFSITYAISLKKDEKFNKHRHVFLNKDKHKKTILQVLIDGSYIDIPEINFHSMSVCKSKDENFILAYNDQYFDCTNGNEKIIGGEVVFINNDRLFLINDLMRPNDGKVAENGNFIINDWMNDNLNGTFYAFNSEAEILMKIKFNSNLGSNFISKNGQYVALETYYSDSVDGNKIFFIDLENRKLLGERKREAGNIKCFQFSESDDIFTIVYENYRKYRYNTRGELLDKDKLERDLIAYANGYELFDIANKKMNQLNDTSELSDYEEVLSLLVRASNQKISQYTKAKVHRLIGEIYYKFDKKDEAIKNFEKALNCDPKVGVKRLYNKLKRINI
jgi:tetratricopeptide (TPR) repeat protein